MLFRSAALRALGIDAPAADRARAVAASGFEQAAAAERAYRDAHPEDRQLINRGGLPGDWRGHAGLESEMRLIEASCADLMREWNYDLPAGSAREETGDLARRGTSVRCRR